MSDGNETNHPASVSDGSETNNPAAVSESLIEVLKGNPSEDEVAALVAVLSGLSAAAGGPVQQPERTNWGLPVDKLRYPPFSWQLITLVQKVHMRR
jgi:hypothetical protein